MSYIRVNCPMCGADDAKALFRKGDLDKDVINVICKRCALVYINPRPQKEEFLSWQKDSERGSGHHSRTDEAAARVKIKKTDRAIKEKVACYLLPAIASNSKILDIGCGFGTLLHILKEKTGVVGDGIELNEHDVAIAKELFGLHLYGGTLEQFHAKHDSMRRYNLIVLHHALEHFADPLRELERVIDLLDDEGILYVAVPNILNIKKRPEIFFQLGHATTFSPASLQKMLSKAGFKIIRFDWRAAYPGGMELLAKKRESATPEYISPELERGAKAEEVIQYVRRKAKFFNILRAFRDNVLCLLPKRVRISIGRTMYLFLKNKDVRKK